MKINWVYDFIGSDTLPNSFDYETIRTKLGNRDLNPIDDDIKHLGGYGSLATSDIVNQVNGNVVSTHSLIDLDESYLKNSSDIFIYPIKINDLLINLYYGKTTLLSNISEKIKIKKES